MSDFPAHRVARRLVVALAASLPLGACVEPIVQPGSPASVESIGAARLIQPREASAPYDQIAIPYVLCDVDLDDIDLDVEICDASGDSCGSPVQGFGSDGTVALPTRPCDLGGSDHLFVWDTCAGIMNESAKTLARPEPDASYTITIRHGASSQTTDAFTLGALGLSELESNCSDDPTE